MTLEVVGHRVLIKPESFATKTDWDFQLDVGEGFQREKAATVVGTIVGVGDTAWLDFSGLPWAKVGDKVYYAKYSGKVVKEGDEEYVIVNDEDIQAIIHEEE